MFGLEEIATTGAPAAMTALGMGTVFACLVILYLLMGVMGRVIPRLLERPAPRAATAATAAADTAFDASEATPAEAEAVEPVVAAIAIALVRHRAARLVKPGERGGLDGWKLAGRVQALRNR